MNADRGGLLKSRAESFARHLQTRLRSLSESENDSWTDGAESEVYYDIDSSLASPEEEATEPIFIATQNRDILSLQRTDSEASTYYDTMESLEEPNSLSLSQVSTKHQPVGALNLENGTTSTVTNGLTDLLDSNIEQVEISSLLKLKSEPVSSNNNNFSDACHSDTFDSLRLVLEVIEQETENTCDRAAQDTENNNVQDDFEATTDFRYGLQSNNCDAVEVDTRQHEEAPPDGDEDEPKDTFCVFCDIEQIKSSLSSDCSELSETSSTTSSSESQKLNGYLEENCSHDGIVQFMSTCLEDGSEETSGTVQESIKERERQEIPTIFVESSNSNLHISDKNTSLSDLLQDLKIELMKDDNYKDIPDPKVRETYFTQPEDSSSAVSEELFKIVQPKKNLFEDDEVDIATRRKQLQRSSSLKTGKTPPGTPGRKKIVRFADVLGLDLADVKTFLDEVPTVPKSAYEDLHGIDLTAEHTTECFSTVSNQITVVVPQIEKVLIPLFQQPCIQPSFLDRVRHLNVTLENAIVSDMSLFAITGLVRVKNMDFHKSVYVRYTINNWHSFSDLQARYIPDSCDGFSDKFSFVLYAHTLSVGQRLEFALRYHSAGAQFWDNNGGLNYVFVCNSLQPSDSFPVPSTGLPVTSDEVTAAFY